MLINFKVENFYSFREEVNFSMIPSREKTHRQDHVFSTGRSLSNRDLLRAAVLYGANASGKSNFIKAFEFAEKLITRGTRPSRSIGSSAFKLDASSRSKPTYFYFEIQTTSRMYCYEFAITSQEIVSEHLFEITLKSKKLLFSRRSNDKSSDFEFGQTIENQKKDVKQLYYFVAEGTRNNQLYLTETADRNLDLFQELYDWFDKTIRIFTPRSISHGVEFRLQSDRKFKRFLKNLLETYDPSVAHIETKFVNANSFSGIPASVLDDVKDKVDDSGAVFFADVESGARFIITRKDGELHILKIFTQHKCLDSDEKVTFELEEESDGTRRLIELAPLFYELIESDETVVAFIDELDRSMHPLLTKSLLEYFLSKAKNKASQIIISTHNTVLLDTELLRRDEIWMIEKIKGASIIKSLSNDYKPRYDKDIRKDYISGEYGAIPPKLDF